MSFSSTNTTCGLFHMDPDTLKLLRTENLPTNCMSQTYGMIYTVADGQVLYANTDQWSGMWECPSFKEIDAPSVDIDFDRAFRSIGSRFSTRSA